jgi:hypothetical protein
VPKPPCPPRPHEAASHLPTRPARPRRPARDARLQPPPPSGFAWVKNQDPNNSWHCYSPTAIGAELEAIKAGFRPVAITYLKDNPSPNHAR